MKKKTVVSAGEQQKNPPAAKRSEAAKRAAVTRRGNKRREERIAAGRHWEKDAFSKLPDDLQEELADQLELLADELEWTVADIERECNRDAKHKIASLAELYGWAAVVGAFKSKRVSGRVVAADLDTEFIANAVALEMRLKTPTGPGS